MMVTVIILRMYMTVMDILICQNYSLDGRIPMKSLNIFPCNPLYTLNYYMP